MFRGIINSAKNAASSLVVKYLARASVAVPFVIGAGFALAALTVMLTQSFGLLTAYWMMAGVLSLVGIVAAAFVSAKEHKRLDRLNVMRLGEPVVAICGAPRRGYLHLCCSA